MNENNLKAAAQEVLEAWRTGIGLYPAMRRLETHLEGERDRQQHRVGDYVLKVAGGRR